MHCHSTCSDGGLTPTQLLQLAEKNKLDYFSITDHDCVDAYKELLNIDTKKYFSGKVVLGAELRCLYKGTQLELLCYGYDYNKIKDSYWVNKDYYHDLKKGLLETLMQKAKLVGFEYKTIEYNPEIKPERLFYDELLKYSNNLKILESYNIKHSGDFYRRLIADPQSPMFFDSSKYSQTVEQLADFIHSCGGVAVLAHPFGVYNLPNPKEDVEAIAASGKIDGIECMHANMTKENTKFLLDLCNKYNLVSTGGSDYHAYNGQCFAKANWGTQDIPTSILEKFIKKVNPKNILG